MNESGRPVSDGGQLRGSQTDLAPRPFASSPCQTGVPEDGRWPTFRCCRVGWPDFGPPGLDVYVWPADLSWTMAFTHEAGIGLGPYLCPREWAGQGTWDGPPPTRLV